MYDGFYLPTYLPACVRAWMRACRPTDLPSPPTDLLAYLPALLHAFMPALGGHAGYSVSRTTRWTRHALLSGSVARVCTLPAAFPLFTDILSNYPEPLEATGHLYMTCWRWLWWRWWLMMQSLRITQLTFVHLRVFMSTCLSL